MRRSLYAKFRRISFLAAVGFLKMTRLFEKANQLLAMSHGNDITGLTFSCHSSSILGTFQISKEWALFGQRHYESFIAI
jgi:hypothetical protein